MLPLGLLLLALDIPVLERPTARALDWLDRRWRQLRNQVKTNSRVGD
jgi:hypothetical protein